MSSEKDTPPTDTCSAFTEAGYDFSSVPRDELEACLFYEFKTTLQPKVRIMRNLRSFLRLFAIVFVTVAMTGRGGNLIDVAFNGNSSTSKTGFAATGVTSNDYWNTCMPLGDTIYQVVALPNLKFVNGTASDTGLYLGVYVESSSWGEGTYGNGVPDAMYGTYCFVQNGRMFLAVTNLSSGNYNFYLYGHGNMNDQNGIFQLTAGSINYGTESTTTNSGWTSPAWQEGVQYVEFSDVEVTNGEGVGITVLPGTGGYAVLSGLQIVQVGYLASVNQEVVINSYLFSSNPPVSFTLGSNAPTGASITTNGFLTWSPTCDQGTTTNAITVFATDSGNPSITNSTTFSVIVGDCVEVNVGSSVVQVGQDACVPVGLFSTVAVTNLSFTLDCASGFLTNWNVTLTNSLIASAQANTIDTSHTQFNFQVVPGEVLQGANALGSICFDTLRPKSQFLPLVVTTTEALPPNSSPATNPPSQKGRVVLIGNQSLLEAVPSTNSSPTFTLYGNPGTNYQIRSTTNLSDASSWSVVDSVTLTDLFQVINLGSATNQMQFYNAVQP